MEELPPLFRRHGDEPAGSGSYCQVDSCVEDDEGDQGNYAANEKHRYHGNLMNEAMYEYINSSTLVITILANITDPSLKRWWSPERKLSCKSRFDSSPTLFPFAVNK